MRILHIVCGIANEADGVSVFVRNLSRQLSIRGHVSEIVTKGIDPSAMSLCDVVHIHALWDPYLHKMAKAAHKFNKPIVWSPHGMLTPWALRHKWWKKILGLMMYQWWDLRRAKLLHVTADSERTDVRRLALFQDSVIVPLGVDNVLTSVNRVDKEKIVLFISRVHRKKGLPNLLRAWSSIGRETKKGWRLLIAGPDQGGHTEYLKNLSSQLGLSGEVEFIGPVYGDEKVALYRRAAIFVLPTLSENFGAVVVEALAQETPVICTKGAPWHDLEQYRCGAWVDIGVTPLKIALEKMLDMSAEERLNMGRCGRELVERKYSWSGVGAAMESAYIKLLNGL